MKTLDEYILMVLFVLLLKRVLNHFFVNETSRCDHSNENSQREHSYGAVYVVAFCCCCIFRNLFGRRNMVVKCCLELCKLSCIRMKDWHSRHTLLLDHFAVNLMLLKISSNQVLELEKSCNVSGKCAKCI